MKTPRPGMGECDDWGYCTPDTSTTSNGGVSWWQQLLNAGASIAKTRYGNPPPGTIVGANGSIIRQATGLPVTSAGTVGNSGGISPLLLLAGIGIIAVVAAKK